MLSELLVRLFELFVIVGAVVVVMLVWLYRKHSEEVERSYKGIYLARKI